MNRLIALLLAVTSSVFAAEKPNIVLINIDDLGYGELGCFGSKRNQTPNLDRMAAEGRMLKSHYAAPVCTPSRASLMTGCYPKRAMPVKHVLFPSSSLGLHPNEVTVAEVLKEAGYATGCIGKWHLGDQPEFLPTRQGFDYYYGFPYSNDMGTVEDGAKSNPGANKPDKSKRKKRPIDPDGIRGLFQPPLPLLENEKVIERVDAEGQTTITKRYANKAADFIMQHKDESFFLYLPHSAVHFPLYPGMKYRGKSGHGLLSDWVIEVDWAVGQVFTALKTAGVEKNTLVIFTSDNGGAKNHTGDNTPLRGAKGSVWEGGVRVPTIVWWPGKVPAGTSTSAITTTMDIMPTFAAIAGGKVPGDRQIDGVDIRSVLFDKEPGAGPRDEFYYYRGFNLGAVRKGPWKFVRQKKQLFNLEKDISESKNVAADHPELVKQFQKMVAATAKDLGFEGQGPGCRAIGKVEDPQPLIGFDGKIREGFKP